MLQTLFLLIDQLIRRYWYLTTDYLLSDQTDIITDASVVVYELPAANNIVQCTANSNYFIKFIIVHSEYSTDYCIVRRAGSKI